MTDVDVSTAPVANEHGTQNNQGFTAPTGGHWGAVSGVGRPRKVVGSRVCAECGIRPTATERHRRCQVCYSLKYANAPCVRCPNPRHVRTSGRVSVYCRECEKYLDYAQAQEREKKRAAKRKVVEPPNVNPVIVHQPYVRVATTPPVRYGNPQFRRDLYTPKRDSNGNPVRDCGSPTVVLMSEDETEKARTQFRQNGVQP